jgi:hypothetical protein
MVIKVTKNLAHKFLQMQGYPTECKILKTVAPQLFRNNGYARKTAGINAVL